MSLLQDLLQATKDAISGAGRNDVALPIFDPTTCDLGTEVWCNNIEALAKEFGWSSIATAAAKTGVTASGCGNHMESFSRSPQYTVTLTDPDEDDDENKCTLIEALTEKSRPQAAPTTHAIGFSVYKLPDNKPVSMPVDVNSFNDDECVGRCQDLTLSRNATARFELEPGTYVIVPSTGEDQEGEFLLRVFFEKANNIAEHGRDMRDLGDRVHKEAVYPETVDTVTVLE